MVTKREYLIEKGLAKAGHGRFSNAAKEEIKAAINKGIKFTEAEEASGVEATAEPRHDRPTGYYTFRNQDGQTFQRLHTTACVHCGYSFQWCYCENGPFVFEWGGVITEYAQLHKLPSKAKVVEVSPRPGRGRPRKQQA